MVNKLNGRHSYDDIEDYKEKYENAVNELRNLRNVLMERNVINANGIINANLERIFPELRESEDEKIRNEIIQFLQLPHPQFVGKRNHEEWIAWLEKQKTTEAALRYLKENHSPSEMSDFQAAMNIAVAKAYNKGYTDGLEKQGEIKRSDYPYVPGWRENRPDNKPKIKHSILMLTIHGVAEGEWLGEEWCQYRWSCKIKDTEVLYWLYLSDLETLEKENVKQGEQEPADKVEPKFNVGDWLVCCNYEPEQIIGIKNDMYEMSNGDIRPINMINNNHNIRLWTIKDVKVGDVLVAKIDKEPNDFIYIFKGYERDGFSSYCYLDAYINKFHEGIYHNNYNVGVPATQEQRDLLFQKMKEAGYEWDAENKELKKIGLIKAEHGKYYYCIKDYFSGGKKFSSKGDIVQALRGWPIMGLEDISEYFLPVDKIQKSAWSEEDNVKLNDVVRIIENSGNVKSIIDHYVNWLKSLKDRVQQPKQEVSEDTSTHEYIDLGLPSGTLWKLFNEDGYYKFDEAVEKFGDLLPTKEQWEELKDECKWVWKDNGYDVIGPNGNLIFLPAVGYYDGKYVYGEGMYGYYWSSIYVNESCAWSMGFGDDFLYVSRYSRNYGRSVRLVK